MSFRWSPLTASWKGRGRGALGWRAEEDKWWAVWMRRSFSCRLFHNRCRPALTASLCSASFIFLDVNKLFCQTCCMLRLSPNTNKNFLPRSVQVCIFIDVPNVFLYPVYLTQIMFSEALIICYKLCKRLIIPFVLHKNKSNTHEITKQWKQIKYQEVCILVCPPAFFSFL